MKILNGVMARVMIALWAAVLGGLDIGHYLQRQTAWGDLLAGIVLLFVALRNGWTIRK